MKLYTSISKNRLLRTILRFPILTICLTGIVLFIMTQFILKNQQDNLSPLAVEIIGAIIIIIILESYLLKIWLKAEYPETKTNIYNRLIGVLKNLSRDIAINFLKLSKNSNDIVHSSGKLKTVFEQYNEGARENIEYIYLSLTQETLVMWWNKLNNYLKVINDFLEIAPLIRPKDKDLACILEIKRRIMSIQEELIKSQEIRSINKKFFSSDLNYLVRSLSQTIDSGLFDSILFSEAEESVIERTY